MSNPYSNPYVRLHPLRIMATTRADTDKDRATTKADRVVTTMAATIRLQSTIKEAREATGLRTTSKATASTAKTTTDTDSRTITTMLRIAVPVWGRLAVPAVFCRCASADF